MKTKLSNLCGLSKKITKHLQSLPPERRPMMRNGFRAQSVEGMEVTTSHGHLVYMPIEDLKKWLSL